MVAKDTQRISPLNLTKDEVKYLWEMMKEEVGEEAVQSGDDRETVESLHTKVRSIHPEYQEEQ